MVGPAKRLTQAAAGRMSTRVMGGGMQTRGDSLREAPPAEV